MSTIKVKSNTYSYVFISTLYLTPMQEEVEEVDIDVFLLSELNSLKNLRTRTLVLINDEDYLLLEAKIKEKNPSSGGSTIIPENITEGLSEDSLPFSCIPDSSYLLGNPDRWVSIDGYIIPSYNKNRLEKKE